MGHYLKSISTDESASYRCSTVLVTGCNGFIGSALASLLLQAGAAVIGISRSGSATDAVQGVTWQQGDVTRRETWEAVLDTSIDAVFHCAAQTSAYAANDAPLEDLKQNVEPMVHLLETCRQREITPFIVLASTITIAGLAQAPFVREDTPDSPLTVYDLHKLFAEQYLRSYVQRGIARGTALRLANVYGPGPLSSRADRGILNQMIRRAVNGESLRVYQPGTFVRDYIHVQDVALAFLQAAANPKATNGRHFVIGTGEGRTLFEAARLVATQVGEKTGTKVPVELVHPPQPLSPIEARQYAADSRQFKDATGWHPHVRLPEGILNMMEKII